MTTTDSESGGWRGIHYLVTMERRGHRVVKRDVKRKPNAADISPPSLHSTPLSPAGENFSNYRRRWGRDRDEDDGLTQNGERERGGEFNLNQIFSGGPLPR